MAVNIRAIRTAIDQELDQAYFKATNTPIAAIARMFSSGIVSTRLKQVDAEMQRLAMLKQPLTPDNPVLAALIADVRNTARQAAQRMDSAADTITAGAVRASQELTLQFAVIGLSPKVAEQVRSQWHDLDLDHIAQALDYTAKPEWTQALNVYADTLAQKVQQIAIKGMIAGQGPVTTAGQIRQTVENLPPYVANTMMRTLQLTTYRDSDVITRISNSDILESQIRIAILDDRTCMACVDLNGEEMPIDERIDDHYNGRCTSISVVKGFPRQVQSGADWFNNRSARQQEAQMGSAAYAAWKAGKIQLSDFVDHHNDPLFGPMIQEKSLVGILGPQAKEYYQNARSNPR